jgi:hypothetical protein
MHGLLQLLGALAEDIKGDVLEAGAVPNIGTDAEPALHRSRGSLVGEAQTRDGAGDAEHALDVAVGTAIGGDTAVDGGADADEGGDDGDAGADAHAGEKSEEHEFMAIDHVLRPELTQSRVRLRRVLGKVNVKALPLFLWWRKCRECGPVEVFGRPRVGPGAGNLRVSMSVFP